MFNLKVKKWVASGAVFSVLLMAQPVFAQNNTYALGFDTVAGQASVLKAKNFPADQSVVFHVLTVKGINVDILEKTNAAGEAVAELSSLHTRYSGLYTVYADLPDGTLKSAKTSFNVYEGGVDTKMSKVTVDRTVIKSDDSDFATISVILMDSFGNPLPKRAVKLIAGNNVDVQISPSIHLTEANGRAQFYAKSKVAGLASFVALETTADEVLKDMVSVSFVTGDSYVAYAGGDFVNTAYAADFGPLSGFELEDIPANVAKNENVSFTVKAVDSDGLVVEDYTGTVRFSAEGSNSSAVSLPENYKFLATDLGQHKFSLGLSFAEDGTYNIAVSDLADKFKVGEITVVVGSSVGNSLGNSEEKPVLSFPAPGTYSQAEQTISGTAKSSSTIKLFDNNKEIGSVPVGPTGKYSYQTDALADGVHSIYVVNQDSISLEVIGTSDSIDITIDTTPPSIDEIVLEPAQDIKPGSVINVTVFSEKSLAQAALIFNYDIVELNASLDDSSAYVGTIQAPQDPGVYKLSVLLVDELQNEVTYEDQATVTVTADGGSIDTPTNPVDDTNTPPVDDNNTDGQELPVAGSPSVVTGVIAYGSDKRVTLVWDAATDDVMVKNYRIYYGTQVMALNNTVETKDASTTWYIGGLENKKEYFFTLVAIDNQGNESANKSEIVSGIPFVLEINNALSQVPTTPIDNNLREAAYNGPFPNQTTSTGPEVLLLLGASMVGGYFVRKKK